MASPAVSHIISEMYLFYRKTPLGASLFYALAKLVGDGDLPKSVAYAVLEEFDHAILKAIRRPKDEWRISLELFPGHLRWYRYCNGIWWFHLSDVQIYRNFPMRQVARYLQDLREKRIASKKLKRGNKFRSKEDFIAVPMETVPSMTVMAYSPFSTSPKFGQRTHYVNGWLCRVHEWEENLNPKISIFRYEEMRRAKKREDGRPHAQKAGGKKASSSKKSFDPRSAAGAAALPVVIPAKSRAEIAKEKEARYLERRARERRERREAVARGRREAESPRGTAAAPAAEHAGDIESVTSEEELLRALPPLGPRPRPVMPWQNKTGVATSGIRQSRPARLTAAPQKKAKEV